MCIRKHKQATLASSDHVWSYSVNKNGRHCGWWRYYDSRSRRFPVPSHFDVRIFDKPRAHDLSHTFGETCAYIHIRFTPRFFQTMAVVLSVTILVSVYHSLFFFPSLCLLIGFVAAYIQSSTPCFVVLITSASTRQTCV